MKRNSEGTAGRASKRQCTRAQVVLLGGGETKYRLAALWRQGLYCDVKLRVGTEVFPAHRNVLAAESTFLSTLFAGQFAEALAPIVDIREMDLRVFKLALGYMYDGSCLVPDVSTLQQLLSVASVLQIDALFAAAATALDQSLTLDNCASMLACADQHHVPQLALRAEAMARDAFVDVASNPAFPASSMVALLQSNRLNVESEEQVFDTLSTWLKGQVEPLSEEEQLQMFGLVRFTLLSQDFRDSTVMAEPAFSMPRARNLVLAQFQAEMSGGDKPAKRAKPPSEILSAEAHRQIISWLDTGVATKLELLYRASYDGWKSKDFHLRCDNKGPTVTVIKCTDGCVFGGFTSTAWGSEYGFRACADAFIFSLHRPGGVGPVKLAVRAERAQEAIKHFGLMGPNFGTGDIRVESGTNSDTQGSTNIQSYALPPGHAPVDALTFFTGAKKFRAAEVEVFRILA